MRSPESQKWEVGIEKAGRWVLAALLFWALAGCGATPTPIDTTPGVQGGSASSWLFRSISDMDPVLALTSTGEHLWVGTPGGLLRYPIKGGRPLRVAGAAGPGGDRMVAVEADSADRVWALSEGGLARFDRGAWSRPAGALPDVGEVAAMAASDDGTVWVGGSKGLVHYNGEGWSRWTAEADVTSLSQSPDAGGGIWVGTASKGIWHVAPDGMISEHVADRGMPCGAVRTLVAAPDNQVWAICARGGGAVVAHCDGSHWSAMTSELTEHPVDLARSRHRIILLTDSHLWRITDREPEQQMGAGEIPFSWVFQGEPARPSRHQSSPSPASDDPADRAVRNEPPTAGFAPSIELPPPAGGEQLPPYLRQVDVQVRQGASVVECDERGIWIGTNGLGVTRVVGVGEERVYRTLDLLVTDRPFTVAADNEGRAWFLTRDLRAGEMRASVSQISPVQVEQDATLGVQILSFGSRGIDAYALGRFRGRNIIRIYQYAGNQWVEFLSRTIDFGAEGEAAELDALVTGEEIPEILAEFSFFEVDPQGRFWIGLMARQGGATNATSRGVIVVDMEVEEVTYHGRQPTGPGAVQIPDDVTTVAFNSDGDAWLGGLSGAAIIRRDGTSELYTEANGLQGEIVNDLAVDPDGVVWVATTSGVGRFHEGRWRFFLDAWPEGMHVASLAFDSEGDLWTGGNRGAVHYDGERWEILTSADGLVSDRIQSVHVDGRDRVWFVTDAGISLLIRE